MRAFFIFALAIAAASPARSGSPQLSLPISCQPGWNCWVQQYFDHDPSSAAADYACGAETYDGHDGTDFRIRDTLASADVVASAAGTVRAVRDGVRDRLIRDEADTAAVKDRECGNGAVVVHDGGWESQYCHLRQGSVVVKAGQAVAKGEKLGSVGYSGLAAFPHVHLTVRKNGGSIDPFRPAGTSASLCGARDPLWDASALAQLSYRHGDILAFGFAPGAVEMRQLEEGTAATGEPSAEWRALVAYFWAINLQRGDVLTVTLTGPEGMPAENTITLESAKAQYLLFSGKKRPDGGWPAGEYQGRVTIAKGGATRIEKNWRFNMP